MPNPHAAKWINPARLVSFMDDVGTLIHLKYPDLSPADLSLCYQTLSMATTQSFQFEIDRMRKRQEEKELDDATQH